MEYTAIGLHRYCFKVSVVANCIKLGGVFTEFGLSKLVSKHRFGLVPVSGGTLPGLSLGVLFVVRPGMISKSGESEMTGLSHLTNRLEGACCAVIYII